MNKWMLSGLALCLALAMIVGLTLAAPSGAAVTSDEACCCASGGCDCPMCSATGCCDDGVCDSGCCEDGCCCTGGGCCDHAEQATPAAPVTEGSCCQA